MATFNQIAETLKSVKPGDGIYEGANEYRDQWNDTVKAMGELLGNGDRNKREKFYALCNADPTNWRI